MAGTNGARCLLLASAVLASLAVGASHPARAQDAHRADRRDGIGHGPGGHGPGEPRPAQPAGGSGAHAGSQSPDRRPDRGDDHAAAGPRWGELRGGQDRDRSAWGRRHGDSRPGQDWQDRRAREDWRGPDRSGDYGEGVGAPYAGVPLGYGEPGAPPFAPWSGDAAPDDGWPDGEIDAAPGYYGDPGYPAW